MTRMVLVALGVLMVTTAAWGKTGRTFYDDQTMALVREKIERFEWAQGQVNSARSAAERWIAMSDQELWDFVPPPGQLRALNVSFGNGCPVHGTEVFRAGGHYPWIMSSDEPFKVTCPVGGESYPSNDFEPWNPDSITDEPETGPDYVDHGAGWVDEDGTRYFFVAHWVFWHRWQREISSAIRDLRQAYLLTDEPIYAHKEAVLLARIARDYKQLDYRTQAYHHGWPSGINGRMVDYIWMNGWISNIATAYDAIYPALADGEDAELTTFLAAQGVDDPRRLIEQEMLAAMAQDIFAHLIWGNTGMYQHSMATLAIVLDNDDPDYAPTTEQMREWLMGGSMDPRGDGDVEYLLWNGFYRDGHGGESSPSYSSGWCVNFYQIAHLLPRLGVDIWANPKVKKMSDIGLDLYVAGTNCPSIGDAGSIRGAGRVGWSVVMQGRAFDHYHDPRHARALEIMGARSEDLFESYFNEDELAAAIAEVGTQMAYPTRNLGGYGLGILEAGEEGNRRGVSMYYGFAGGGHGHFDRLTLEMQAFGRPMMTDMGYPAHWLAKNAYWTSNTISHYAVVVDEHRQETMNRAFLNTLAASPQVQLMDAEAAHATYPNTCSMYRRTAALIDTAPDSSYLLDIFRVDGGYQHDYSYHGPALPEFTVAGAEPGPVQEQGTVMGEDVEFGGAPSAARQARGGGLLLPLRQSEDVLDDDRPYDVRSLEGWATYYSGNAMLTRTVGGTMTLPLPVELEPGAWKVFVEVYDYNAGSNAIEVRLGDVTQVLRWEPSGTIGFRWISEVFELDRPASEFAMTANEVGQSYVLLNNVSISDDVNATHPRSVDVRTSGFQYLFHPRRMAPEGPWSATWRDPEEDLALTMFMPQASAQEIILADAEPELQPGAPPTLQYLLARNAVPADQPDRSDLASTYVTVSEPHRGDARVQQVRRLDAAQAVEHAVGLVVDRAGARDLIHSSPDPAAECTWDTGDAQLSAAGEFAVVTLADGELQRACLVNGTRLACGDFTLTSPPSPAGRVVSVDHGANRIVLDAELPVPGAYVGRVMILGNELQQTSYTIVGVEVGGGQTIIDLGDTLMLVQMGYVEATDDAMGTLRLAKLGRVDGGQHQGRWLYNEDRSVGLRISSVSGNVFTVEGAQASLDAIFADLDGDGRGQFWVSDIGPGDTWRVPTVTFIERAQDNLYRVHAMTEVELSVPMVMAGEE